MPAVNLNTKIEEELDYKEAQDYPKSELVVPIGKFYDVQNENESNKNEIRSMLSAMHFVQECLVGLDEHCTGNYGMFIQAALLKIKPFTKP